MQTVTNSPADAKPAGTAAPPVRPLVELLEAARLATCGECWAEHGAPCVVGPPMLDAPDAAPVPAGGVHVARFGRAMRRGLITGNELLSVVGALDAFTPATVVYGETPGGPAAAQQPADEPWARTSGSPAWRAYRNGLVLTVTRSAGGWLAVVESGNVTERCLQPLPTRLAAQSWCDNRAGGAR